jgi:hypothetical protein
VRQEIQAAYGNPFPRVPGRRVRFFQESGPSRVTAEVFADGSSLPEWSAERGRLEGAIRAVCERYGVGVPIPAARTASDDEM